MIISHALKKIGFFGLDSLKKPKESAIFVSDADRPSNFLATSSGSDKANDPQKPATPRSFRYSVTNHAKIVARWLRQLDEKFIARGADTCRRPKVAWSRAMPEGVTLDICTPSPTPIPMTPLYTSYSRSKILQFSTLLWWSHVASPPPVRYFELCAFI